MKTIRPLLIGLVGGAVLGVASAGCAGSGSGGPTPVPATPTAAVTAPATPVPVETFAGQVVELVAKDRAFSVAAFEVEAGKPFEIRFENLDPYNHAFYIVAGDTTPTSLSDEDLLHVAFRGDYFAGPATMTHHVAALPAGTYTFFCPPHVPMTGTIVAR